MSERVRGKMPSGVYERAKKKAGGGENNDKRGGGFEIGTHVEGNHLGLGKWYPGQIIRNLGSQKYDIIWEDHTESIVERKHIRLPKEGISDFISNKRKNSSNGNCSDDNNSDDSGGKRYI